MKKGGFRVLIERSEELTIGNVEEMLFLRLGFGFINNIGKFHPIITAIRSIQVTSPIYTTWLYNAIDVDALLLFLIGVLLIRSRTHLCNSTSFLPETTNNVSNSYTNLSVAAFLA